MQTLTERPGAWLEEDLTPILDLLPDETTHQKEPEVFSAEEKARRTEAARKKLERAQERADRFTAKLQAAQEEKREAQATIAWLATMPTSLNASQEELPLQMEK